MGVYLTVRVVEIDKKKVSSLQTLKGELGSYVYAFDEESLCFERSKFYYYMMPVERAIKNLKEVKEDIENNIFHEKLDEWSKEAVERELRSLNKALEGLLFYQGKELFLFCDEEEYLWVYDENENENAVPHAHREGTWESLREVGQGLFYGTNLSREQKWKQYEEKENLMKLLREIEWIEDIKSFTSYYDPQHLIIGDRVVNRFVCTIQSNLLICGDAYFEQMDTKEEFIKKLKSVLLPYDVSIDENRCYKYKDSIYKFLEGLRDTIKKDNIESEMLEKYLNAADISSYDHKAGLLYMELYSKLNNPKLRALTVVDNELPF